MKRPTALVPRASVAATLTTQLSIDDLNAAAREYILAASSPATRRAYASDWRTFTRWCAGIGVSPMPADAATLVRYLTHLATSGKKVSTVERARAAISVAHETAHPLGADGKPAPNPSHSSEVKRVMKGIRNKNGAPRNKKTPVRTDALVQMLEQANDGSLRGIRDAAMLAVGYAGAFRRSELAAMKVEHLRIEQLDAANGGGEGLVILIPKSKTDQEGKGQWLGIQHQPTIDLLKAWLARAKIESGHVFCRVRGDEVGEPLKPEAIAEVVKKYATALGLDPAKFAGHSLRRGFASQAIFDRKNPREIMKQTRHKSIVVFEGYVEESSLFHNNASKDLWKVSEK